MVKRLLVAVALGATAIVVPATPALASGGCSGEVILINFFPGAEPPSTAVGHAHVSGNHYIKSIRRLSDGRRIFSWWADNNGGRDGDTPDTFYASTYCN